MSWSRLKLTLVSPFVMWLIVIAGIVAAALSLPRVDVFQRSLLTSLMLVPAVLNWLHLFIGAMRVNRRAPRSAAAVEHLVTTGVYAKVRHPIYSADIILAWGGFFFHPTLRVLVSVVWLTIVLIAWMRLEEQALISKFPEEYPAYKSRTPMIIPNYLRR